MGLSVSGEAIAPSDGSTALDLVLDMRLSTLLGTLPRTLGMDFY